MVETNISRGVPGDSEGKESAFNTGDPSSIPGSGRYPEEQNGRPFQYSCLEKSMNRGDWQATVHGFAKNQNTAEQQIHTHTHTHTLTHSHTYNISSTTVKITLLELGHNL